MARILTYHELEQTVYELEKDLLGYKNAKEDVEKAKKELILIFNSVPDYIAIIDKHFIIQRANKALIKKLECKQEKLIGEFCWEYICMADSPPTQCPHAKMLSDGKEHFVETYSKTFGASLLVTSSPLYDNEGRLLGGVYVARDITTLKETEEVLQESEQKGKEKSDIIC